MTKQNKDPVSVQSLTPCLAFAEKAEEAINFYVSVFKNSRIKNVVRTEAGGPLPAGQLLHASFELNGREYTAMDGGPHFQFSQAISLVATCESQKEIDDIWSKLTTDGKEGPCGWLTDKFGVSWQIIPRALGEMFSNPKAGDTGKLAATMMTMKKLDVRALEQAYRS